MTPHAFVCIGCKRHLGAGGATARRFIDDQQAKWYACRKCIRSGRAQFGADQSRNRVERRGGRAFARRDAATP